MLFVAYVDGGAQPNPGHGGAGVWLMEGGSHIAGRGLYLGEGVTNNEAEYRAMIFLLELVDEKAKGPKDDVIIKSDSEMMVRQLSGEYAVRAENLVALHKRCVDLVGKMRGRGVSVAIDHVVRAENAVADRLASTAIARRGSVKYDVRPPMMEPRIYSAEPPSKHRTPFPSPKSS